MRQRHVVVIPRSDGGVEVYAMKTWLRDHPDQMPPGLEATDTSHKLRDGLKKMGWTMQVTTSEVRLFKPGAEIEAAIASEVLGSEDEAEEVEREAAFSLEYQLRDFLADNLGTIAVNGQKLSLYVDPQERDGIEYPTAVGPIDILAVDGNGSFFVFELKRANSPDSAIGQVARYMGWVQKTIGKGHEVFGVIVAKSISDKLRYAISVVPNVHLFEYQIEFHLQPAHELKSKP